MAGFPSIKDEVQDEIVDVNIVGGASSGTQYTEGDTDASITGTAIMWEDAGNALVPVSAAKPLPVDATIDTTGLATSAKQDTIIGHLDGVETLLTDIESAVDGLEGKDYATAAKQDTIIGHLDGVESTLTTIDGRVDGIEGLLTTIDTDTGDIAASVSVLDDWDNAASDGASVSGDVAHDGVDAGEPVKIGYKAVAHGTNPTAVAANDRTNGYANRAGIPFVLGGHPNIITLEAAYTAAQTDTAIITVSAGTKIVVTQIAVVADNANTVDVGFRIGFGVTNTPTTTGVVLTHPGLNAGSGFSRGDGSGILGVGGDGEDLRITSEVPTTGSIRALVSYFTIES